MNWRDWIDFETIRLVTRHASGVIPVLLIFGLVGLSVELLVKDEVLKIILRSIDGFVVVGLILFLAWEMLVTLFRRRG